jgi:hypothetical protein
MITLKDESELRDIKLIQEQPTPAAGWAPYSDYDFQVRVTGVKVNIENVMLLNPAYGIQIVPATGSAGTIGQVQITNLRGQPLIGGMYIDNETDVSRFDDIHFWPFWSLDTNVLNYIATHSTGIFSLRNDAPMFHNLFVFRYNIGVWLSTSPPPLSASTGPTHRPFFSNFMCDFCATTFYITGDGTDGVIATNVSSNSGGQANINVIGNNVSGSFSNVDFGESTGSAVLVTGNNDTIAVDGGILRSWNTVSGGYAAFKIGSSTGSVLSVNNILYNSGHGAALLSGSTVVLSNVTNAPGL